MLDVIQIWYHISINLMEGYIMEAGDLSKKIQAVLPMLNEAQRRIYLATEAAYLGRGGITKIKEASGISRVTITNGMKELEAGQYYGAQEESSPRIRKAGAGRKGIALTQPGIKEALDSLMDESTIGDPMSLLRWTTKSLRNLEKEMHAKGFTIGYRKIGYLLQDMGYSLQLNQKKNQVGKEHPDRDKQFEHINHKANMFIACCEPVISIDCKKKENIGNFKNTGAEYSKKGKPVEVLDHDFPLKELGKAAPYGVYDIAANEGYVNVGISSDTAQFAVNAIRSWWNEMGKDKYPEAHHILITADGGGSNGSRVRLWKVELQKLVNELNIPISVCHFPPGTSKWNKIEHRLFSQITKNWRGRPLVSLEVIVNLIASTTTEQGLIVKCNADNNIYETGIKVSDEEFESVNLYGDAFHPDWNYTISPA